jgi:hypothetical protein
MKSYQQYEDLSFFPLDEGYKMGQAIASKIESGLPVGRTIITPEDAGVLAQTILMAKHANHIEIGSFFGGSAILAAMVKKHFGMHGLIHCIDPLDARPEVFADKPAGEMATRETLYKNAEHFGVADRIILHQAKSKPWPLEGDWHFGTGYIDGDHWNGMPYHDWKKLSEICSFAVVFDDYCIGKPEVIDAVAKAAVDPRWMIVRISGLSAVLRRRQ